MEANFIANSNLAYQIELGHYPETPHVRHLHIPPEEMRYENLSELGQELYRLSMEIAESGERLMTEEEWEREMAWRKGVYYPERDLNQLADEPKN